jgi:hypothetical protein
MPPMIPNTAAATSRPAIAQKLPIWRIRQIQLYEKELGSLNADWKESRLNVKKRKPEKMENGGEASKHEIRFVGSACELTRFAPWTVLARLYDGESGLAGFGHPAEHS